MDRFRSNSLSDVNTHEIVLCRILMTIVPSDSILTGMIQLPVTPGHGDRLQVGRVAFLCICCESDASSVRFLDDGARANRKFFETGREAAVRGVGALAVGQSHPVVREVWAGAAVRWTKKRRSQKTIRRRAVDDKQDQKNT